MTAQGPTTTRMSRLQTAPSSATLTADVTLSGSALEVRARVQNIGRVPIYVLDQLWRPGPDGKPERERDQAYRWLEKDTLRLLVGVPPLPQTRTIRLHLRPFATRVAPGATLDVHVLLPTPVHEYDPYFGDALGTEFTNVTANAVELYVQLVTEGDQVSIEPAQWPEYKDRFAVTAFELGGRHDGELVAATATLRGIPAQRRSGEFVRVDPRATPMSEDHP